ncbi:MAG: polyprenyl synthetase family protein [Candidatus Marinimicrobia bacterium]|jgi:geranylgeranyl diphosphate synthase type II|nr:polyprenyl synthetase [Candidatus Neomarinimicrobiota bacterium]MDP6456166.1 polyprenyl synthetase family protein [Candidatus Neomarinimicrobiota bacterium]MDP6593700.1 polyprenyl synthetase family protein [Candidatus Neomarinimicrobiota bacterium]MDP6836377.1 polyprenyl synthetase family protein [Candidatus Neomarinimicrobiota bacterium]|tara:strand:- start:3106 stop:4080 length:975 start_codon:yes stop_codon:yes gene_type:complete
MSDSFQDILSTSRERIDRELLALVKSHEPTYLYEPVRYVFKGRGKRLRPILLLTVADMFDISEDDAMPAALAVEILHNFSLVHDDIMDQDDLRHGQKTVYREWDESTAILAGDAIFALAFDVLSRIRINPLMCIQALSGATLQLCEGQALDKTFESRDSVSLDEYLNMVKLKTGTLLSLCCRMGAILGDGNEQSGSNLAEFGILLGQAFQIQDDVLEIYSDSQNMGKSLGSDVTIMKKTYLTCSAMETDPDGWRKMLTSMGGRDLEDDLLPALRNYFEEIGVRDAAAEEVARLSALSKSNLDAFSEKGRANLNEFADMVMTRKR